MTLQDDASKAASLIAAGLSDLLAADALYRNTEWYGPTADRTLALQRQAREELTAGIAQALVILAPERDSLGAAIKELAEKIRIASIPKPDVLSAYDDIPL